MVISIVGEVMFMSKEEYYYTLICISLELHLWSENYHIGFLALESNRYNHCTADGDKRLPRQQLRL